MFHSLIYIFFVLSCVSNGLYFLWVSVLLMFPPILHNQDRAYSDDIDIHLFTLIPCLNEEKVITATVDNLLSLKMPNTTVVVINDGSTDNTLAMINSIKGKHLMIINRVLPYAKQGKGKALNDAYNYIKKIVDEQGIEHSKVVIGILDADTFIKRSLLERVAVIMNNDPKAGMVQTRVRIGISTRDYFLPRMQDLEFFSYINQMQNIREYTGTVAAAGNGQFNRLSAMEMLGNEPWSQCLLEDFDFSLRLLLKGWRTRLLQDETIYQQGVIRYKKFIKQRTRWAQGCIQCIPYLDDIIKSKHLSFYGKIEVSYFLMLPLITMTSIATMVFSWFLILYTYWFRSSILFTILRSYSTNELLALLIIIVIIVFVPGIIFSIFYWNDTKESMFRSLLAGLFIPIYNMLQMPAVLIAVFRQSIGDNSWAKTDHI